MPEEYIQNQIYTLIKKRFGRAGIEVSVLNRCVDIVYENDKNEVITIEVKLKNWQRAIKQAKDHQLYADKSYICLPRPQKKVNKTLITSLEQSGIGLLLFEFKSKNKNKILFKEFIGAKQNVFCWPSARKKIESMLYV